MLILWLLSEGPVHGYRLKRILDEPSLRFWFPVEVGSIYAALANLAKGGFIEAQAVERQGLRPERTRYRILPEGRKHLQELLRKAWCELPKVPDLIQIAFAARSELEEGEIVALIAERARRLRERLADLDRASNSAPASEMVSRLRALTRAELDWTESLLSSDFELDQSIEIGG